jgi:hypothetical protein
MLRLIEPDFTSTGKLDLGYRAPPCIFNFGTPNALLLECRYLRVQIVTHEIEFVPNAFFGWMNGYFRWRQRKDQPIVTSIHRWKSEDIPEESTISRRVFAVHDHVRTKHHEPPFAPTIFCTARFKLSLTRLLLQTSVVEEARDRLDQGPGITSHLRRRSADDENVGVIGA